MDLSQNAVVPRESFVARQRAQHTKGAIVARLRTIDADLGRHLERLVNPGVGESLNLDAMFRLVRRRIFRASGIAFVQ